MVDESVTLLTSLSSLDATLEKRSLLGQHRGGSCKNRKPRRMEHRQPSTIRRPSNSRVASTVMSSTTERTPLLRSTKCTSDHALEFTRGPLDSTIGKMQMHAVITSTTDHRPSRIIHSATMSAQTSVSVDHSTALLSRPLATHSSTSLTSLSNINARSSTGDRSANRPSLLRRATDLVSSTLDLGSKSHGNAPTVPSHWTDHAHRVELLKTWDAVDSKPVDPRYRVSLTARLVSTEKPMLEAFSELDEGERPLTREWIEYVLGVALRQPFCAGEKMGRWERLSDSAGARANWGPW